MAKDNMCERCGVVNSGCTVFSFTKPFWNRQTFQHPIIWHDIFREKEGHIEDTPENRSLLEAVANNKDNYVGTDRYGIQWYSKTQADGSQVWVRVKNNTIQNGGINNPPKTWNPSTGYNKPKGVDSYYEYKI